MRFEVWFWEGQHWQCTTTGIAKETKEASWKVVPNPFTGQNYLGIPGYQFYIVPFFMLGYAWFMVTVVSTVPGCWPFLVSLGLTSRPRSHRRCQRSKDSYDSNLVRCSMTVCDSLWQSVTVWSQPKTALNVVILYNDQGKAARLSWGLVSINFHTGRVCFSSERSYLLLAAKLRFCTRPYRFSTVASRLTKYRSGFVATAHLSGRFWYYSFY